MIGVWIAIGVLIALVVYLLITVFNLKNELIQIKYVIVEKKPDGGHILKNSKGQIIFEL